MALVGDNGAGKSTLIKCVAGTHAADSGADLLRGPGGAHPRAEGRRPARDRGRVPGPRAVRQPRRRPEHVPRPRAQPLPDPLRGGDGAEHDCDPQVARGHDDQVGSPAGRDALRRPAPVGRGREGRAVELEARRSSTSRPRLSASRRRSRCWSSCAGSASRGSPSCSSRTTSTTSSRPPTGSRSCGSGATSACSSAARRRSRRSSRRSPPACPRRSPAFPPRRRGRGMTSAGRRRRRTAAKAVEPEEEFPGGFAGLRARAWLNLRTGNLGPAPIIVGLVVDRRDLRPHGERTSSRPTNFVNLDHGDGGHGDARVRRRLRAPARRDRPLDRLPRRHRRTDRRRAARYPGAAGR